MVVLLGIAVVAATLPGCTRTTPGSAVATPAESGHLTPGSPSRGSGPSTLPFSGLKRPNGVAVDSAGNVYVTDGAERRVVKLAAGSAKQTELAFTGLENLTAGSGEQTVLPFTGLSQPYGVAVNTAGEVYITDSNNRQVLQLPAGSDHPAILPLGALGDPESVATDLSGNVYVADSQRQQVIKIPAG